MLTGRLGMMSSLVSNIHFVLCDEMLKENHVHQMWIKAPLKKFGRSIQKSYINMVVTKMPLCIASKI